MLIYCSTRSKQFLLLYKATFVTGRLLLRLNLEREVTAGLLLRVLLPPPTNAANGFRTCNVLSDVT